MISGLSGSYCPLAPTKELKAVKSLKGERACRMLLAVLLVAAAQGAKSQGAPQTAAGEWTWAGGSKTTVSQGCVAGVYGTMGKAAAANAPGGRWGPQAWTDSAGNLWLFGGQGCDSKGTVGRLNDLWKYTPSTGEWTWVGGTTTIPACSWLCGNSGVYGTLGTAAAANIPGGRSGGVTWTDAKGSLWLFGGEGDDGSGNGGLLNDLWKYSLSSGEWTWVGGGNNIFTGGVDGVYGTLGKAAASNMPGSRTASVAWEDANGNLWLLGGWLFYDNSEFEAWGDYNDLWEYSITSKQWAWMGGSEDPGPSLPWARYGTLGHGSTSNIPGGRSGARAWTDAKGDFWLFGGTGYDEANEGAVLNDLWEYEPSTGEWTWVGGSGIPNGSDGRSGDYGTLGAAVSGNAPGSREGAAMWVDAKGNAWLMGGWGVDAAGNGGELDDLWMYATSTGEWTWMGGSDIVPLSSAPCQLASNAECGIPGILGTQGQPSLTNFPGSREPGASWTDAKGNLWTFGGWGYDSKGTESYLNDLWVYEPSPSGFVPVGSAVSLATSSNAALLGASVTFTATATSTAGAPTGTVTFSVDSKAPVDVSLNAAGQASYSTSALALGQHTITAAYLGNSSYAAASSAALNESIFATQVKAPVLSPNPGTYSAPVTVTLSEGSSGATVYYTTNGTTPSTSSTKYTASGIKVNQTETISAIAAESGYANSAVTAGSYLLKCAMPSFSPAGGKFTTTPKVTISDTTAGATIYYTTNGTTPTTSSTQYKGLLTLTASGTVEAIAVASGYSNSSVATAVFNLDLAQTIEWAAPSTVTYGADPITFAPKSSSGLPVSLSVVSGPGTLNGDFLTITGAGNVVVAANQAGDSTYASAPQVKKTITVNKAPATATAVLQSMTYGGPLPALTYKLTGFVNGDTQANAVSGAPLLATTAKSSSPVGSYPITIAAGTLAAANYSFIYAKSTLIVGKAPLKVTANNLTMKAGAALPTLTYTMTGFVNGDTQAKAVTGAPKLTTTAKSSSAVGSYPITISAGTLAATNYALSFVNGTLTVSH